jgi:hypothetical protein
MDVKKMTLYCETELLKMKQILEFRDWFRIEAIKHPFFKVKVLINDFLRKNGYGKLRNNPQILMSYNSNVKDILADWVKTGILLKDEKNTPVYSVIDRNKIDKIEKEEIVAKWRLFSNDR